MADDSPFPPSKRGTNPRSLANLRPHVKGDPSRNPEGHNGRVRAERVAEFLEAPEDTDIGLKIIRKLGLPDNTPRIDVLLHREFLAGLGKSDLARKGLREQYAGRPRQQMDLTSSDRSMSPNRKPTTAEARQELDRILEALDNPSPDESTRASDTQEPVEGGAAPDSEPKAEP